jgi:hypothetical protein
LLPADDLGDLQVGQKLGELIHGEHWRTLALPKSFTKLGAWVLDEVLDEDTYIQSCMVENSDDHYALDISRAKTLLGWEPRHSLFGTLPAMVERLKADPTDWYEMNKLDPSVIAGSEPELRQAEARLRGPLERSIEQVEAAVARHRELTCGRRSSMPRSAYG